jgi:hypothetical protein
MKKILLKLLSFLLVIAVMVILLLSLGNDEGARYVFKGNSTYEPIVLKKREYQCSECTMDIEALSYATQLVTQEGNTYFFDEVGCMVLWLQNHTLPIKEMFVYTYDTHRWIEAEKAWYSRTASTPMGYGFTAFEEKKEGFIPFEKMKTLMLQGQNLHDPFVKKHLLGEDNLSWK